MLQILNGVLKSVCTIAIRFTTLDLQHTVESFLFVRVNLYGYPDNFRDPNFIIFLVCEDYLEIKPMFKIAMLTFIISLKYKRHKKKTANLRSETFGTKRMVLFLENLIKIYQSLLIYKKKYFEIISMAITLCCNSDAAR